MPKSPEEVHEFTDYLPKELCDHLDLNFYIDSLKTPLSDVTFLPRALSAALDDSTLSDVTLVVGNEKPKEFKLHKLILSVHSPVFKKMFTSGNEDLNKPIVIADSRISANSFDVAVQYFYGHHLDLDTYKPRLDSSLELYHIAHKYDVSNLLKKVQQYLLKMTSNHFAEILDFGLTYDDKSLISGALKVVQKDERNLFSESLQMTNSEVMKYVISEIKTVFIRVKGRLKSGPMVRYGLEEFSERAIWKAVVSWAKKQYKWTDQKVTTSEDNIRNILKESGVLQLIKFGSFSEEEFTSGPESSGILTEIEIKNIRLALTEGEVTPFIWDDVILDINVRESISKDLKINNSDPSDVEENLTVEQLMLK